MYTIMNANIGIVGNITINTKRSLHFRPEWYIIHTDKTDGNIGTVGV